MEKTVNCPSLEQYREVLELDSSPQALAAVEEHLSCCADCRAKLERSFADPPWWPEASESLREQASTGTLESEHSERALEHSEVLRLLGPTDDPRMLGRIGPYEIVGILGRGGMGVVFKGFDAALNRYVAIKMLLPHLAATGAARQRFAREAQAAAAVVDDHVMPIHCVADWQGVPYLVMPYSRGVSLQQRLTERGPLELREVLRIGMQTAAGLAAAHAQGLVHRDVKPANILLAAGVERVTLTDFGLARAVDDVSLTRTGTLTGTPQYMSPEQARGQGVDTRSDLFSLGSVMYAMCAGRPPFRAESSYGVLRLITDEEPRPIQEINADVPVWLCAIVARLMAKQPANRFATAAEVAQLLEGCLAHVQQPSVTALPSSLSPPTVAPVPWHHHRASKVVVAMIAALAVGLVAVFAWPGGSRPITSDASLKLYSQKKQTTGVGQVSEPATTEVNPPDNAYPIDILTDANVSLPRVPLPDGAYMNGHLLEEKELPGTPARFQWGKPQNGLSLGIVLTREFQAIEMHRHNIQVVADLFVRNVSDKPIKFQTSPDSQFGTTIYATDETGQRQPVQRVSEGTFDRMTDRHWLVPGSFVKIKTVRFLLVCGADDPSEPQVADLIGFLPPSFALLRLPPGRHALHWSESIPPIVIKDVQGRLILPAEGEWTGRLVGPATPLTIGAGAGADPGEQATFLTQPERAKAIMKSSPRFHDRVTIYRAEPISGEILDHHVGAKEVVIGVGVKDGVRFGQAFNLCLPDSEECVGVAKVMELEKRRCIAIVVSIDKDHVEKSLKGASADCGAPKRIAKESALEISVSKNVWQTESLENIVIRQVLEAADEEAQILIRQENSVPRG